MGATCALIVAGCGGARPRRLGTTPSSPPLAPLALSEGWSYTANPQAHAWTAVSIPNDFNPVPQRGSDRGEVGWYRVRFTAPAGSPGRSWEVHFESVRRNATVWLNGRLIGRNSDPYAPFDVAASGLQPERPNTLLVRVDNTKQPGSFPEDWWNWGGILGPVTLQPVGRIKLSELGVMPELACQYRCADLLIRGVARNMTNTWLRPEIGVSITSPSGTQTAARQALAPLAPGAFTPVSFRVPVSGPLALWSPGDPSLYGVKVSTFADGNLEQVTSLRSGLRSVEVRSGVLYLNGRRLWLHGAAIHEDVSGRGAALSDGDIDTLVSGLRSVGANITRAHYLLSPRLLDALDEAGILVWSQPPVGHADQQLADQGGRARALQWLRDTIIGERSHPSVIVDSVANELSPTPDTTPGTSDYLNQAVALARSTDPAALVGLDTYCYPGFSAQQAYRKLDVLGISSYFGWYDGPPGHSIASFSELAPFLTQSRQRYPGQALVISEFGAEGLFNGPPTIKGSFAFQSNYLQRTFKVLSQLPFANGMIYWTLREFAEGPGWVGGAQLPPGDPPDGLHHKGLIAYDGSEKPAFGVAEQLFADPPPYVK